LNNNQPIILVGDNPFHGISHLSQERSRARDNAVRKIDHAADLVLISLENGANGFMFSVSETSLSILRSLSRRIGRQDLKLYAIVPYMYEYVRLATQIGGISGLARRMAKQIVLSANMQAVTSGMKGLIRMDPSALLEAYLFYEIARIKSSIRGQANLDSVMLHEVATEMLLALNLDWLAKSYIDFLMKLGIKPGFETRNFSYLVRKFTEWNIDFNTIFIAAPFNKAGFQMNPSRRECEKALKNLPTSCLIAFSILAAGYLKPPEAMQYIGSLPNLEGVAVGVSKKKHAHETFSLLKKKLVQCLPAHM